MKNAHTGLIVVGQDKRIMHSCLAQRDKDLTNFSCFCLVIDYHEFRDSIVKVPVGSTRRSANCFDNVVTKFIANNRTDS